MKMQNDELRFSFKETIQMLKKENSAEANEVIQQLVEVKSAINVTADRFDTLFDSVIAVEVLTPVKCDSCCGRIKCVMHAKDGKDFDASIWRELWNGDNFRSNHTSQ
jgi:hypothetical protein